MLLQPAVWLRYAECLNALGDKLGAITAYEKVVELVPSHCSARVSLSALHQQLSRPDDALRALLPRPLVTGIVLTKLVQTTILDVDFWNLIRFIIPRVVKY